MVLISVCFSSTIDLPFLVIEIFLGLFDSYALFSDMIAHPTLYLNGTAPLNVTGASHACVFKLNESTSSGGVCTDAVGSAADSFLW